MYLWRPHAGQQTKFCSRGEFEVLFGGAAGPGKTDCLIIAAARNVGIPGYKGLLLRRTFPQLQEIIDRCFTYYPVFDGFYKSTEHRWYFPNGSFIQLGHMQHQMDKYNYQGKEYHFVGFDELTQFLRDQYLYLFSRARSTNPLIRPVVRATTNPGGIGHSWVWERFIQNKEPEKTYIDDKTGLSRAFIPATIEDNPTLFEGDPEYIQRLEALPEVERLRLRYGVWDAFEGQVFRELQKEVHGCEPFDIPPEWPRFMVFDWGYAKPFSCGWYAVDFDGVLYRYREWYGMKEDEPDVGLRMTNTEIAKGILERETDKVRVRVADPAIWNRVRRKDGGYGPSVQQDMRAAGVSFIKANNDRIQGKQQVHERFRLDDVVDKAGAVIRQEPRVQVFTSCTHFWRTMMLLQEDDKNPEDVDTDQEDHVYDEFRYGCMHKPLRPKRVSKVSRGSFAAERDKYLRAKKYAERAGVSMDVAYARVR